MSMKWLNVKNAIINGLLLSPILLAGNAYAAASGSVVFDPSNYVENSLTAAKSVKQLEQQILSYEEQKYGLNINLRSLSNAEISKVLSKYPNTANTIAYLSGLNNLENQLGITNESVMQQIQAWHASNLTPQQYIQQENQISSSQGAYAAQGFNTAKQNLQAVNQMAATVKQQGAAVGNIQGAGAQRNLVNAQLHTLTQQNQMLLSMVAQQQMNKSANQGDQAAHQQVINKVNKISSQLEGDNNNVTSKQASKLMTKSAEQFSGFIPSVNQSSSGSSVP